MLHKEFWGLLFLGFVVWILAAAAPDKRIENFCRPVVWTGNVVTSMSALVLPQHQTRVQGWFNNLDYGCQYTVWRLFYQDDYNKWKATQDAAKAAPAPASAPASSPASAAQ